MNILPLVKSFKKTHGQFDTAKPLSVNCLDSFIFEELVFYLSKLGVGGNYFLELSDKLNLPAEGYQIVVSKDNIKAYSLSRNGLLYAMETIKQLAFCGNIECGEIIDYPTKPYRGFMLDCGRYFFSKADVKKFADLCLLHKLNVFHWHLCEDQGFRMEVKKYPLLTQIGSKRTHTNFNHKKHEGFYSQEDIKEIVAYFAERGIEVIPELEMPGHTQAMLASYSYLGCFDRKLPVATHWGVKFDILCAGKESTYLFLENILSEMFDLFPSKYIHLGGDEAPKLRWSMCPDCNKKLSELGLDNFDELQAYMVNRINEFLVKHGKTAIMWNEENPTNNFSSSIIWQYYTGCSEKDRQKQAECLKQSNRKVIYSYSSDTYLDLPYKTATIKNGYEADIDFISSENVLGVEAPLWTEYVPNYKNALYKTLPRLGALSETAWCEKSQRNYGDFIKRYYTYCEYLKFNGFEVKAKSMIKNPPLKLALEKIWFSRRPIHWQGLHNLLDNNKVKKIADSLK